MIFTLRDFPSSLQSNAISARQSVHVGAVLSGKAAKHLGAQRGLEA